MSGPRERTLTRRELTAALAARQLLLERRKLSPAAALRRITPVQGQEPPSPFIALAARLDGFERRRLERAIDAGTVVRATLMRMTLHLAAAADLPAYSDFTRRSRLRLWRTKYPGLDEEKVAAELRRWFAGPRTTREIRERVARYDGVPDDPYSPLIFADTVVPLVRPAPAGHWPGPSRVTLVADARPQPTPAAAARSILTNYLKAFGPASRGDVASWSGVAQRDFADDLDRLPTVVYRDEDGRELLDLAGQPLPPASTRPPVRLLGEFEQVLLAYADRDRVMPADVQPLKLTLSGARTVTVAGRVAASWHVDRDDVHARLTVTPHVDLSRRARTEIRAEAEPTARLCEPDAGRFEIVGV